MNESIEIAVYRGVGITKRGGYIVASMCNFIGGGLDDSEDIEAAKAAVDQWINTYSGSGFK